jgi:hypothetical protein
VDAEKVIRNSGHCPRRLPAGAGSFVWQHHGGPHGTKPMAEVVADILAIIKERRA